MTRPASSEAHRLAGEALGLEQVAAEADAQVSELLGETGADTGGLQAAPEAAVIVDAHAVVEQVDVLQGDDVTLHALHLCDMADAAAAVPEAADVHDEVKGRRHLLADGPDGQVESRH